MERELKLRIPIEDLEKLRHAPLFAQSEDRLTLAGLGRRENVVRVTGGIAIL
jgi:hypothetical protein